MDPIEIATAFIGTTSQSDGKSYSNIAEGTATSDSENGYVMVDMGGMTVSDDDGQSVKVATCVDVRKGDRVQVSLTGTSGKARAAMVIGVVGGGDRTVSDYSSKALEAQQAAIQAATEADEVVSEAASAAQETASQALEAATATGQHFWSDDSGAHVSYGTKEETSESGSTKPNSLLNSLGMLIKRGASILAQFTSSAVAFYDGSGTDASNITAQFTPTSAQIGKSSGKNIAIGSGGLVMQDNGKYISQHTASSVSFYDGSGNDSGNITAQFGSSSSRIGKTSSNYVYIDSSSVSIMNGSTAKAKFESSKIVLNGETTGLTITGNNLDTYIIGNNTQGLTIKHNLNGSMQSQIVLDNNGFEFDGVINSKNVMFRIASSGTEPIIYVQVSGVATGQATLAKFAALLSSL